MRTATLISTAVVLMSLTAAAAGVWETKPFTEWSDKDVEKVMTDSPWAGKASITHGRIGGELGPVPDWKLIISIRSALPYRQALLRQLIGQGGAVPADQAAALAADEPMYLISISGIQRMYSMQAGDIAGKTVLRHGNKEPLKPVQARMVMIDKDGKPMAAPERGRGPAGFGPPGGGAPGAGGPPPGGFGGGFGGEDKSGITATLILGFPRGAIAVEDGELEVSTLIGGYAAKRTFKLKDMVLKGALTL